MAAQGKIRLAEAEFDKSFWKLPAPRVPVEKLRKAIDRERDEDYRLYARKVVWWATPVEIVSSFNRLQREGDLTAEGKQQAMRRLAHLRRTWSEVQSSDEVRDAAERLLNVHKLRAADGLQLSAALLWCSHRPRGRHFIAADGVLARAAEVEGFVVIRL